MLFRSALLENAQFLERIRTASNRYDLSVDSTATTSDTLPVKQSPRDGIAQYTITFTDKAGGAAGEVNLNETHFELIATPTGSMAGDKCGSFVLNEKGTKTLKDNTAAGTVADCWNK